MRKKERNANMTRKKTRGPSEIERLKNEERKGKGKGKGMKIITYEGNAKEGMRKSERLAGPHRQREILETRADTSLPPGAPRESLCRITRGTLASTLLLRHIDTSLLPATPLSAPALARTIEPPPGFILLHTTGAPVHTSHPETTVSTDAALAQEAETIAITRVMTETLREHPLMARGSESVMMMPMGVMLCIIDNLKSRCRRWI